MILPIFRRVGAAAGIAILAGWSFAAQAASDGSLGATSTGSVNIGATIPGRVQISGLTDLNFNTISDLTTAAVVHEDVCVWSNTSTRGYNITATGDNGGVAGTAFKLSNGTSTLAYGVEWSTTLGATSGQVLTAATAKTGLTSTATSPTCGTKTASLIVKLTTAQMQAAVGSNTAYAGVLTLLVAPE